MLNWLTRYVPAVAALEERGPLGSLLDVGCGQHGIACVRPDLPFVGFEIEFAGPTVPTMVPFQAPPGPLPFRDGAFDTVLCLDALEHVPRPQRAGFVAELARVSARRMFIACPSSRAQFLDDRMRRTFAAGGYAEPSWLREHGELVLPEPEEIERFVTLDGFAAQRVPMVNSLLSTMLVLADMDPELSGRAAAEVSENGAAWAELLTHARFGESFREGWLVEREAPLPTLVDAGDLRRSAMAALREDRPAGLRTPAPAAPLPALDSEAALKLWLSPRWSDPDTWLDVLAAYLAAAGPRDDVCLCLDASAPDLPLAGVLELVSRAYDVLGDGSPTAEVLLVDRPVDRGAAVPVATPADVAVALAGGAVVA